MSDNSTQNGAGSGTAAAADPRAQQPQQGQQDQQGQQPVQAGQQPGQHDPNSKLPQFALIRIYAKDCSLETPHSPEAFQEQWKPQIKPEIDVKMSYLGEDRYEVVLRVTVTCECDGKKVFIAEVNQAGLFLMRNFNKEAADYTIRGTIPNILFPYAREHIASMINRATFPVVNLYPMNFEAAYRIRKAQEEQAKAQKAAVAKAGAAAPANEEGAAKPQA